MIAGKQSVAVGLGLVVLLALGAWIAGRQIRSPAQVAAETAAPQPSPITVPVERRVLASEVKARGTVRYGSPQPVVLAASEVKQGSGDSEIVTTPPRRGTSVGEGTVAMTVSGRPVFVLQGVMPSHRDLGPGTRGPDVAQLEGALERLGFSPGSVDGVYDGDTAAAVAAWYESQGWEPFGPTDIQLEQLRSANAAAAAARDLHLQALLAIRSAAQGVRRDNQLALADIGLKQATLNKAIDARTEALRTIAEAPPDTTPGEQIALQAAYRQAADDVAVARLDLRAARKSAAATEAAGEDGIATARANRRRAMNASRTAAARVVRAEQAVNTARRQADLASRRLQILMRPGDTSLQRRLSESAAQEARETEADAARVARQIGIVVPANEVLFFGSLPLRVDSVRVRRGDSVTTNVMTVSNSRLAIDSSLSLNDAKLVRPGARVTIEEPDLGVRTTGVVTQMADRPGTHKVDPARVYLEVAPGTAPVQLVGASVTLTIAVKTTRDAVLTVPVNALSVGADGSSRVERQDAGGQTEYVDVEPGLAAHGLVEVRPVSDPLTADDLVIVGARGSRAVRGSGGP